METRAFVSSTCYDLAPVREHVRALLSAQGHHVTLSEEGDVLFDPALHTHASCLVEVGNSDLLVLIIGGRFGGTATPQALKAANFPSTTSLPQNLSITQAEAIHAIQMGIPLMPFVASDVLQDHRLYEANKAKTFSTDIVYPSIQKQETAAYIFEFINFLRHRATGNSLFAFASLDEITRTLNKQLSALLRKALHAGRERTRASNLGKIDDSWSRLLGRSIADIERQVSAHARNKYIPGLYVARQLQPELLAFHADELQAARALKTATIRQLEGAHAALEGLEHHVNVDYQTRYLDDTALNRLQEAPRDEVKMGAARRALGAALSKWLQQRDKVVAFILVLRSDVVALLTRAKTLSETRLLNDPISQSLHQELSNLAGNDAFHEALALRHLVAGTPRHEMDQRLREVGSLVSNKSDVEIERFREWTVQINTSLDAFLGKWTQAFEDVRNCIVRAIDAIARAPHPCFLVVDRAGGGKTNLVCEVAKLTARKAPCILLFGKQNLAEREQLIQPLRALAALVAPDDEDPFPAFDAYLQERSAFAHVLIDGINECRNIAACQDALLAFLAWATEHRVRVSVTCRDIYWEFFDRDRWSSLIHSTRRNELYRFNAHEYATAISLYLEHYRLKCVLKDKARESCEHPLLLRFFCAAYGNPQGSVYIDLGTVASIRLKELFDIYFNRKADQIRQALRHHSSSQVSQAMLRLAGTMRTYRTQTLPAEDAIAQGGDTENTVEESIYVRLLDEDIIIEEKPGDSLAARQVSFVYEEFLEYLVARGLFASSRQAHFREAARVVNLLAAEVRTWVNARGVVEYFVLMLLDADGNADQGYEAFRALLALGKAWTSAFWSIVSKLPASALSSGLRDVIAEGVEDTPQKTFISRSVKTMALSSAAAAHILAETVLWSSLVPRCIGWVEIAQLDTMDDDSLSLIVERLRVAVLNRAGRTLNKEIPPAQVLGQLLPYLPPVARIEIQDRIQVRGLPVEAHLSLVVSLVFPALPVSGAYLVNGLVHPDDGVAKLCAERLRSVKQGRRALGKLLFCAAEAEQSVSVASVLRNSAAWLTGTIAAQS